MAMPGIPMSHVMLHCMVHVPRRRAAAARARGIHNLDLPSGLLPEGVQCGLRVLDPKTRKKNEIPENELILEKSQPFEFKKYI